ncbi:TIGR02679 family protein [Bacillus marinisedimentorum]|uniref:TIGR02679 family protein n=1 Tax=Bacillus marinisedimentorum TaxID=1821260 RepID=UPI0008733432|nr:TIGR02679 family protein [Bacillus marinisedimentorum]
MADSPLQEALDYFGGDPGFHRLFSLFKKKYESYGRIGGSVRLTNFQEKEIKSIARFFGDDVDRLKAKGTITLLSFERKLQETKFEGLGLLDLLQGYFDEPLVTKKEAKEQKQLEQQKKLARLSAEFLNLSFWFRHLQSRSPDTYWINRLLDEERFADYCRTLSRAMAKLPADYERLPVFSQRIAGNPHAFDLSTELGKLWIHVLHVKRGAENMSAPPADTESINDLLMDFNLLRDDITNYVTCANITAETEKGEHPMWKAASETASVMNVPMRELLKVRKVYPQNRKSKVWIVENSGVFSSLLDAVPHAPLICTHGQFKLAALRLLDMMVASGCKLSYAGDFDPEGLAMAVRLKERYRDNIEYWRMSFDSYKKSNPTVSISEERLFKLNSLTEPGLSDVVDEMKRLKRAGYQEALLEIMINDLKVAEK